MMCTREASRLHRMGATDGFRGPGRGGVKGPSQPEDRALNRSYLQSRGNDEEIEKSEPPCGFGEGKMKKWGVELESQNEQTRHTNTHTEREGGRDANGNSTPVHQGSS